MLVICSVFVILPKVCIAHLHVYVIYAVGLACLDIICFAMISTCVIAWEGMGFLRDEAT